MKIQSFNKRNTYVMKTITDNINTAKQSNAIMPNFIHSMDASLIIKFISNHDNLKACIHDCFGTHPNHMSQQRKDIIKVMVYMYLDFYYQNKLLEEKSSYELGLKGIPIVTIVN